MLHDMQVVPLILPKLVGLYKCSGTDTFGLSKASPHGMVETPHGMVEPLHGMIEMPHGVDFLFCLQVCAFGRHEGSQAED